LRTGFGSAILWAEPGAAADPPGPPDLPRTPTMSRPALPVLLATVIGLVASTSQGQSLPETRPWDDRGDAASAMVAGIHRFLDRETEASVSRRQAHWTRDLSSPEAYTRSIAPNRERFLQRIGAVGPRVSPVELSFISTPDSPAKVAEDANVSVYAVRWTVYPGVNAEGLWLEPKGTVKANVVALADCALTPEQFAGISPGLPRAAQKARLFAQAGCRVLVPTLIDRSDEFAGNPEVRMTNQPHREWIYRQAYETGRHIIGYEVDEVRAAVDWFTRPGQPKLPIGVAGAGEGGLIAFYAAAADPRIDEALVESYFEPRESVWAEPIYRNVWGLLEEFGDAEIASLISPRTLTIETAPADATDNPLAPLVAGPPPARNGRAGAATGRIREPKGDAVAREITRWKELAGPFAESKAGSFLARADAASIGETTGASQEARPHVDPRARMKRLVEQLAEYTQALIRTSELRRSAYWEQADTSSPERWTKTTEPFRRAFHEELIGAFPKASEPLRARSVRLFDEPKWTGYAVELPVWSEVVASGILLLPKDLKPGERRPVVVCQHGLEGRPEDVVDPRIKSVYHAFGAQLADRGYIVYAPQNPYIGKEEFRLLQRKLNPLKRSLFSVIVRQHERTLEWLSTLPQVDPERIAFYGLSYGGKTAMRVPSILTRYCLSICSGDFNEWVVKNTNLDRSYSYMFTGEYEMFEFGLAERFNYAEMAALIAPRPFQVERGHKDGVAPDEWIGYEYAKVKRLYDTLGLADRVDITYFNAGHQIEGKGTFAFLAKHLNWPDGR
jgi:dienelactone hydrolase